MTGRADRSAPAACSDPLEDAELEDVWRSLGDELDRRRQDLLMTRMQLLRRRGVPLRVIAAGPVHGAARLGFADGTALLVRADGHAALATALLVRSAPIRIDGHWRGTDGTVARLSWPGHQVEVAVLGLDQPD